MNGRVSSLVVVVVTVLTVTAPVAGATTVGGGGSAADATATQSAVGEIRADEAVDSTQAAVGPADVAPSDLAGNGTEADPYVITNVSELQAIEDDLDAHYVLGSDIDASNTSNWNRGLGFDPIARGGSDVFTGTFDGAGHTISGLYISRSFERHVGIFGVVGSAGRVGNVTLADLDVAGNRTNVTYNTGGLVATNNGTVHNVTVTGTVAGASDTGSVVGYSSGPVRDISGSPTVIGTNVAGGFVGRLDGARLSNVTTTGVTVVGEVPEDAEGIATILSTIGGVVGETESGSAIENVTVTDVNVTTNRSQDPRRIGGLVGENHGPITDVSVTGEVDGWFYVGGVVGITNARVDNVTADVRVTGTNSVGGLLGSTAGDPDSPMLVDATVSGFVNGTAAQIGGAIGANSGLVRNVTSNATVVTDEGSTIGGLVGNNGGTLTDVSASGRVVSNDEDVGGLVGVNAGTVEDATASTRVAGNTGTTRTAGADNVGGLVGTNYGTIRNASATGYVTGSENVGGLVGNHQDGVIKLAIAYGDVFGSLSRAGGLVGFQDGGDINNTAAHGNVTGNDSVGGLIGELSPRADAAFTEKSFATGRVRGNTSLGGVVGAGDGAFNSYWDVETTNQTTTAGDLSEFQDADGLRTDQMTGAAAETNMTELSFGDIWLTRPDDYPTLAIRPNRSTAPGGGGDGGGTTDSTPPSIVYLTPAEGQVFANTTDSVTIEVNVTDDGTGVSAANVSVFFDGVDVTANADTSNLSAVTYTATALAPGTSHTVAVVASDDADNSRVERRNFSIAPDTSPPTVTLSALNTTLTEGTTLPAGSSTFDVTVSYADDAAGVNASSVAVRFDGQRLSNASDATLLASNDTATVVRVSDLANGSTHTVAVSLADAAGNRRDRTVNFSISATAQFSVSDLQSDPTVARTNESVTFTANVTNTGNDSGTETFTAVLNGSTFASKTVTLAPGETTTVTFNRSFASPGTYTPSVDGVSFPSVEVREPADLALASASLNRSTVGVGEAVRVSATVENTGGFAGSFIVNVTVNGSERAVRTVTVPAEGTNTTAFTLSFASTGEYPVGVNGNTVGIVTVTDSTNDTDGNATTGPVVVARNTTVPLNGNGTVPIVLTSAPEGLSGYNLTVTVGSTTTAEVVNASVVDSFDLERATVGAGAATARLKGVDLQNATVPGDTNVTLGTVDLQGLRPGTTTVTVSVVKMDDDSGQPVNRTVRNGTVEVRTPQPLAPDLPAPTDPDGDGEYEDINGNGELDFDDVVELFQHLETARPAFQDFNGNGRVDFDDVVELFTEVGS